MSERRPLDRARLKAKPNLKKEWVSIAAGDVCVWGLTAAQMLTLGDRIQRPGMGIDTTAAALWLILLSTHLGDEEDSPPVWNDLQIGEIANLSGEDFAALSEAAQQVNARGVKELDELRDFTPATGAPNSSASPSSASSNSTGSLASSNTSLTGTS